MKTRKNNLLKFGVFLFGISLLLWNCKLEPTPDKIIQTLEPQLLSLNTAMKNNEFIEITNKFKMENLLNPNTYSKNTIDFTIDFSNFYKIKQQNYLSYTFLIKRDSTNTNVVENLVIEKKHDTIRGYILKYENINYAQETNNLYLNATVSKSNYEDDINKLIDNYNVNLSNRAGGWDCQYVNISLPRSCSVHGSFNSGNSACANYGLSDWVTLYNQEVCNFTGSGDTTSIDQADGPGGGGGSGHNDSSTAPIIPCDSTNDNDITSSNGGCFDANNEQEDPCKYIKLQIQNPIYTQQANILKTKTGLKKETGYKQNKDGRQIPLTETNNGHSLKIPIDNNTIGYMHTHLDDFLTGETDPKTGNPIIAKPIRMFSPADLIKFLQIVKKTKYNGVPTHLVYATIITSTGNYTLRFKGNTDNLVGITTADDYTKIYKKLFKKYKNNVEKAFLHFIKEVINIDGINLYRIRDNGDIEKKTLKDNGQVDTNDC